MSNAVANCIDNIWDPFPLGAGVGLGVGVGPSGFNGLFGFKFIGLFVLVHVLTSPGTGW